MNHAVFGASRAAYHARMVYFAKNKPQLLHQFEHGTKHVTGHNIIGHQWFLGFEGLISSGGDIYLAFEGLLKRQTASINGFVATA
ncbi:hypothetical protein [Bifidobacterium longum]